MQTGEGPGSYIQAWRHRLQPADAGLPASSRRTRGLRREELASLAGISVDYLVRLEQGRATNPSTQVLAALSRALRLTIEERDHLYTVAGQAPPRRSAMPAHVPPSVQRLVDRMADLPVSVYDPAWTIITWNAAWAALMGDASAVSGRDRNLIWRTFTGKSTRVRKSDAEADDFETNAVADLRRAVGTYPDDAGLRQLVDELRQASPRFARLWAERVVNSTGSNSKTIDHPRSAPSRSTATCSPWPARTCGSSCTQPNHQARTPTGSAWSRSSGFRNSASGTGQRETTGRCPRSTRPLKLPVALERRVGGTQNDGLSSLAWHAYPAGTLTLRNASRAP